MTRESASSTRSPAKKPGKPEAPPDAPEATVAFTMEPAMQEAGAAPAAGDTVGMGTEVFRKGKESGGVTDDTQKVEESQLASETKKGASVKAGSAIKTTNIGDYKLVKKLGQGGMGAVYKARQVSLDRDVALKVLSKELAGKPGFVERFKREARVMAKLDHPNILRSYDVGEAMGFHYLSIEYVEGGSIADWLKKLGKFSIGDALHIVLAVARGLQHAHEEGMIHRDIKPDNVLLTKKGVVKVADLGLAKATDDDLGLTRTGTGAGTPIYMAPEQARDAKHVDARCDIYALGIMLYVFLTGQPPFQGNTLVEVIEAKEKGKFRPIRAFEPEVPERLDLIVDKMLAKEVKHRFGSCAEIIEELETLGLANDRLSFLESSEPMPTMAPVQAAPTKAPAVASKTKTPSSPGFSTMSPKTAATSPPPPAEPKIDANIWYWRHTDPKGRTITKKVTTEEVHTLIKSGSIDATAQISRLLQSGYRAIGACMEFESYFRSKVIEKKAKRGAEMYKEMIQQIEKEEARRQRWKGVRRLFSNFGSAVGLIVWLAVVGGILVGGYFAVKFILEKVG